MFNSGAVWDNAKKLIETGYRNKETQVMSDLTTQAAAVIGDTVGDPLKDTAGPSLHICSSLRTFFQ